MTAILPGRDYVGRGQRLPPLCLGHFAHSHGQFYGVLPKIQQRHVFRARIQAKTFFSYIQVQTNGLDATTHRVGSLGTSESTALDVTMLSTCITLKHTADTMDYNYCVLHTICFGMGGVLPQRMQHTCTRREVQTTRAHC